MAHSWHRGSRPLAVFCTTCLAIAASPAHALALGEPEIRSALGESLDIRIPVTIARGESIEPSCFTLTIDPDATVPRVAAARVSIERSARGAYLRVRSEGAVNDPAVSLGIAAACPGQLAEYHRTFSVLIDPRRSAQAPQPAAPAALASPLSAVATLIARIGDTLESIANAIFPGNRPAKAAYIEALREANPPLAALGDADPIPVDAQIALPDLRTFSKTRAAKEVRTAAAPERVAPTPAAPAETREPVAPRPPRVRVPRPAVEPRRPAHEDTVVTKAPAPAPVRTQPTPGFVLKLSSGEIDLSPSRGVDERMRAQLRDRQLVLDADDQVAAVLALRNSVRQLESRVAELQLKLAGMPSSFPPPKVAEPPPVAPPAVVAKPELVAPAPAAKPEPAATPVPVAKPEPAPPVVASPTVPAAELIVTPTPAPAVEAKVEPVPAPTVETKTEPVPAPAVEAKTEPAPRPAARLPVAPAQQIDWLYYGLWVLVFLLVAAAALLAWRLARRRREESYYEDFAATETAEEEDDRIVVADELLGEDPVFPDEPAPLEASHEYDPDLDIGTRFPDTNSGDLGRRYIDERFPEIVNGAIVLDDPASVVKGARLFYEDGALARAVELLQFAIERNPEEVRTWLALFEIFRLERLAPEFAELARRFREHHGMSDYWRKVQYFGREIDPGFELYAETPLNTFETIGPSQARRLAAGTGIDPVTENWLGAPMDFENEVLANELRQALMTGAGITEQDLVPNPMPALRNIEMFTVA